MFGIGLFVKNLKVKKSGFIEYIFYPAVWELQHSPKTVRQGFSSLLCLKRFEDILTPVMLPVILC